ncbi:MAG TPA: HD domain-containing protein [Geobacteraceae bacterium]
MNAVALLEKYFTTPAAREIVIGHSRLVAAKALRIADALGLTEADRRFIEEAAMLHDIGVCRTAVPDIGCLGNEPYIRHGIIGREILEAEGLPRHALVCERHIGVGLAVEDIRTQHLPLPERDMSPLSLEERIICFADLFFSKKPGAIDIEKSPDNVKKNLGRFGEGKLKIFEEWLSEFAW